MDILSAALCLAGALLSLCITNVLCVVTCPTLTGTMTCSDTCCPGSDFFTLSSDVCCTDIFNNALNSAGNIAGAVSTGLSTVIIVVIVISVVIFLSIIACIVCCVCAATKTSAGAAGAVVVPANPSVAFVTTGQPGPPPHAGVRGPPPHAGVRGPPPHAVGGQGY